MLWQNNGIWGLRNHQACPFPADNAVEKTKWEVKNTKSKEATWSVWIYCRISYNNTSSWQSLMISAWKPCREGCFLPLIHLYVTGCLAFTICSSSDRFFVCLFVLCLMGNTLSKEDIVTILKYVGTADTGALVGWQAWSLLFPGVVFQVWLCRFPPSLSFYKVVISFTCFGWWSRTCLANQQSFSTFKSGLSRHVHFLSTTFLFFCFLDLCLTS